MGSEPDYSRPALGRFIEFVVDKNLVHPATAQGWRVATTKVLEQLGAEGTEDVRRIDVDAVFRAFLNRNPGRLSPASVGEYRRRVGRAIEEFVRWMEEPGTYAFRGGARGAARASRPEPRQRAATGGGGAREPAAAARPTHSPTVPAAESPMRGTAIALEYPLRPDLLAQVVIPRDLTVEEARRMGAFLVTLAVDFRPAPTGVS